MRKETGNVGARIIYVAGFLFKGNMDWKETLLTDDFKAYRKRQVEEIARLVHAELKNANSDYLRGLLDMANRIIKLPSILIKDEKKNMELNKLLTEDLTDLTIYLVREQLKGE